MDIFQDTTTRYLLLLLAAPLWLPVLKALWEEVNWMLRDDGGVFGQIPNQREREELLKTPEAAEDPLVEEPILTPFERQRSASAMCVRSEASDEVEPKGFARSGKVKQPTGFR